MVFYFLALTLSMLKKSGHLCGVENNPDIYDPQSCFYNDNILSLVRLFSSGGESSAIKHNRLINSGAAIHVLLVDMP